MESTFEVTQHKAARLAGFLWVLTMATSMFAELYCFSPNIVRGDVAQTAKNILANETVFRLGVASMLFTSIAVIVLIWAFYVLLGPVNRHLAMLAAFLRLGETIILTAAPVFHLVALRYISGVEYLNVFEPNQLYALMNISMSTYGSILFIGFVCLGLGSSVYAYLFLKSGYVPKAFAVLGIFSSLLLALSSFSIIIFPELRSFAYPYGMVPIFFYEVGLGFWLWIKGARIPST